MYDAPLFCMAILRRTSKTIHRIVADEYLNISKPGTPLVGQIASNEIYGLYADYQSPIHLRTTADAGGIRLPLLTPAATLRVADKCLNINKLSTCLVGLIGDETHSLFVDYQ